MKSKEDVIKVDGYVKDALRGDAFKIEIEGGHIVTARISGKIRMNNIRIVPGDKVSVELSPYDLTRGRIVLRYKD